MDMSKRDKERHEVPEVYAWEGKTSAEIFL